jgi:hypothetical protein
MTITRTTGAAAGGAPTDFTRAAFIAVASKHRARFMAKPLLIIIAGTAKSAEES